MIIQKITYKISSNPTDPVDCSNVTHLSLVMKVNLVANFLVSILDLTVIVPCLDD